jgi:hypothetical protein
VPARRVDLVLNRAARRLREDDGLAEVLVRAAREAGVAIHETRSVADLAQVALRRLVGDFSVHWPTPMSRASSTPTTYPGGVAATVALVVPFPSSP